MPPLLAALLMIELGCDLRIVEAVDLGQEWRHWQPSVSGLDYNWYKGYPCSWYAGWLGSRVDDSKTLCRGTFGWPVLTFGRCY